MLNTRIESETRSCRNSKIRYFIIERATIYQPKTNGRKLINRQSTFETNTETHTSIRGQRQNCSSHRLLANVTSRQRPKKRTINKRCSGYRSRAMTSSLHSLREKNHRCVRNAVRNTKTIYIHVYVENRIVIVSSVRLLSTHENFVAHPIALFDESKCLISFFFFSFFFFFFFKSLQRILQKQPLFDASLTLINQRLQ